MQFYSKINSSEVRPVCIRKNTNFDFKQVNEKQVLPSAEDVKAEKTHQGLIQGVESFTPEKLNKTKTREPATGADLLKTEMAHQSSVNAVENFDKNGMKHVETQEKNPLPDADGKNFKPTFLKSSLVWSNCWSLCGP